MSATMRLSTQLPGNQTHYPIFVSDAWSKVAVVKEHCGACRRVFMASISSSKSTIAMPHLEPFYAWRLSARPMPRVSSSKHIANNPITHRHRVLAPVCTPVGADVMRKKRMTSASVLQGPDPSPREETVARDPSTDQTPALSPPSADSIGRNTSISISSSSSSNSVRGQLQPDQRQGAGGPTTLAPTDVITWGGFLPSTRRFVLGSALASALALGANFIGITSSILGLNSEAARSARVDLLYPVGGFKRCLELSRGFEFIYPSSWLGDQRLVYRAVERSERERSLDPPSLRDSGPRIRSSGGGTGAAAQPVEPLVAFGPAGGSGELNVSVVVADVPSDFRLERFGNAEAVGTRLLENIIAPKSSGLEATLLEASQRTMGGVLYYEIEFKVAGPSFRRHNLSVFCVYNAQLFSINAQAPETEWANVEGSFRVSAATFKVLQ